MNTRKILPAVLLAPAAVAFLVGCGKATSDTGHLGAGHSNAPVVQVTDQNGQVCNTNEIDVEGYCPGDSPSPSSSPSVNPQAGWTISEQQAWDKAVEYLVDGQGFSYQGLINQLSSQYGNGFSVADSTFAVNQLSTDTIWNAQAVISAKNYMQSEPGWSACSLVQQLDSPYGGYFTQAQAEYAVQTVGLGTC